jgi:hypothetical protein
MAVSVPRVAGLRRPRRDERGDDPLDLPAQVRTTAAATGEDQVVNGAEKGERQRSGVSAWPDPAQLFLRVEIGGEVPLDVPEPARVSCRVLQRLA